MKGKQTITFFASIMIITSLSTIGTAYAEIPDWLREVAGFWAQGGIDDQTYLNTISWLIENGFIVISTSQVESQTAPTTTQTPPVATGPTFQVKEQFIQTTSSELQAGIEDGLISFTMLFGQNAYDSGKKVIVPFELTTPGIANIKTAIFDQDGNTMWSGIVQTDEFGKGKLEFTAPTYYTNDQTLEVVAFFEDNTSTKRQAHTTISAIKIGTEFISPAEYEELAILNVELTVPISKTLELEIQDTDRNIIHQERITTNEFGKGKSSGFAVPIHYRDNTILPSTLTFVEDTNNNEHNWDITVNSIPVKVTFTTDKEIYNFWEKMTIYVSVEPPTPNVDIKFFGKTFEHGILGGSATSNSPTGDSRRQLHVATDELGKAEIQGFAGYAWSRTGQT